MRLIGSLSSAINDTAVAIALLSRFNVLLWGRNFHSTLATYSKGSIGTSNLLLENACRSRSGKSVKFATTFLSWMKTKCTFTSTNFYRKSLALRSLKVDRANFQTKGTQAHSVTYLSKSRQQKSTNSTTNSSVRTSKPSVGR